MRLLQGTVTAATVQGWRAHQEDRYVVRRLGVQRGSNRWLLAVLDGHGGAEAAELCREYLAERLKLRADQEAKIDLRGIVAELDDKTRGLRAGTTLSLAWVCEDEARAEVAVLGDSPVFAINRWGRRVVGPVHNVRTNLDERDSAVSRGGAYMNGYLVNPPTGAGLQVARALGDALLGDLLCRSPDTFTVELSEKSLLVLATDGVVDFSSADTPAKVRELVAHLQEDPAADAHSLLAWAATWGLVDNATAVVWRPAQAAGLEGCKGNAAASDGD